MTLTTEQLRARAESLGLNFFIEQRAGVWVKEWFNNGCTSATAEEVMMWSMLANREAQSVAYNQVQRDMMKDILVRKLGGNLLGEKLGMDDIHAATMELIKSGFRLYSAPPAPENARQVAWEMRYWNSGHGCWHDWERITAEQHAEMSVQHATDNDYEFRVLYDAPPAPAVNASPDFEAWFVEKYKQTERLVKNKDGTYKFSGVQMAFSAWSDGRAAMLAQPVSQRYKLPVELHNYDGGCLVFGAADDANEAPEGGNG
jgi:hypothetical protein